MRLRSYALDSAHERVVAAAKFRVPQRAAFDATHRIIKALDSDIPSLPQERLIQQLRELNLLVPYSPPDLVFELATGVGKTKLMGALIAYLFGGNQTRNCLILASRTAILDKLERECLPGSPKYLFIDAALVSEPSLCFRSNLESFRPHPNSLNVVLLSPQTITGGDRRFSRPSDFGPSLEAYLKSVRDLIVFTDEAHHLPGAGSEEASAWREAVRGLGPRLHFGFTATPVSEPGSNIIYSYNLAQCLRDGLYTKAVKMWVEPVPESVSEEEWDRVTLEFGLHRLNAKRAALQEYCASHPEVGFVEPVMLINARDKVHADEIAAWLKERRGFGEEEIYATHSGKTKTEDEIKQLVAIDGPDNKIRVVVNVFQLTEGWDVTNVYVVVPLRAMATFQNAIQSMGRGLRLPAGRRVGDPEVDTLDVLCFGKETFEQIVKDATAQFGSGPEGSATISIEPAVVGEVEMGPLRPIVIKARVSVSFEVPSVTRIPPEPILDFAIATVTKDLHGYVAGIDLVSLERTGSDKDALQHDLESVVREATQKVIADLKYLSAAEHAAAVAALVRRLLTDLGASSKSPIAVDPLKVAIFVGEEIDKRYKQQAAVFKVEGSPRVVRPGEYRWPLAEQFKGPIERIPVDDWQ